MATSRNLHLQSPRGAKRNQIHQLEEEWGSLNLKMLAERLRHYSNKEDETDGGVTSSVGMPASVASANDVMPPPTKKAAVLLCLFQGAEGELRVILTKRTGALSSHSGEVALPGGKRDEDDVDDAATALREAHEEMGLQPSHVRVVTLLEPFLSKHLLMVTPVVGLLPERDKFVPTPNAGEVDAIFDAPLEMFLKDERHRSRETEWRGIPHRIHYFDFDATDGKSYTIWGLTATILIRAASIILQHPPAFPYFSPDFNKQVRGHKRDPKL